MLDCEKVIFEVLNESGTPLKTLVATRINVDKVEGYDPATQKGIKFRVRQGVCHQYIPVHNLIVDFWCFGGTDNFSGSQQVYRALHDLIHGQVMIEVATGTLLEAKESVGGQNLIDPDSEWYFTFSTFSIALRPSS